VCERQHTTTHPDTATVFISAHERPEYTHTPTRLLLNHTYTPMHYTHTHTHTQILALGRHRFTGETRDRMIFGPLMNNACFCVFTNEVNIVQNTGE